MITSPTSTSGSQIAWKHNDKNVVTNNSFYGATASPSIIGVSFNDNPSANKQFKSFSIETNNPTTISGLNTFIINKGSGNGVDKSGSLGPVNEKGGILYGHIGSESRYTMSNFEFIGRIKTISASSEEIESVDVSFWDSSPATFLEFESVQSNAFSSADGVLTNDPIAVKEGDSDGLPLQTGSQMYNGILILTGPSTGLSVGDDLYFAYPSTINGEAPKGQVADVSISLGSKDFEVYALNLEYSPTNLDHNN